MNYEDIFVNPEQKIPRMFFAKPKIAVSDFKFKGFLISVITNLDMKNKSIFVKTQIISYVYEMHVGIVSVFRITNFIKRNHIRLP